MPERTAVDLAQARALVLARRHRQARERLQRVVTEDPTAQEAWCLLALCHAALREPARMLAAADAAVTLRPDDEWGHRLRSFALSELDRHPEALEVAREAVRLAAESWKTHVQLARALRALGLAECLRAAQRATELAPGEPEAHFVFGSVSMDVTFAATRARQAFRRVLDLDPAHTAARAALAALSGAEPSRTSPEPEPPPEERAVRSAWRRVRRYLRRG